MKFAQAQAFMRMGNRFRLKTWFPGEYIFWNSGYQEVWYHSEKDEHTCPFDLNICHNEDTEWELVKDDN